VNHRHSEYEEISGVPEITDFKLLWISGFYDGPTSGLVQVGESLCWAQMIEECSEDPGCGWYRKYKLMKMSVEQILDQVQQHALFAKFVSGQKELGWDWTQIDTQRPHSEWSGYYDQYGTDAQDPVGEVVGWFVR
jgi:hypothetical protein